MTETIQERTDRHYEAGFQAGLKSGNNGIYPPIEMIRESCTTEAYQGGFVAGMNQIRSQQGFGLMYEPDYAEFSVNYTLTFSEENEPGHHVINGTMTVEATSQKEANAIVSDFLYRKTNDIRILITP